MPTESQRKEWDKLDAAIHALNLAEDVSAITPAAGVFGSVSALLTMIRDSKDNKSDLVELGLFCAKVCRALERVTEGRRANVLSDSVLEAIEQLTETVDEMQRKIAKQSKRSAVSQFFHAKIDKEMIATWRAHLTMVLLVFNTQLEINTHTLIADMHSNSFFCRCVVC